METSCSPLEETAMDVGLISPKSKSKAALNRRPSGYWKVFSNWWRGRYAALKTRPTVNEVIEWYHRNAASSWPSGQVPCLKAVLRQSKGLRPIDGLKEYFREYRKKRKQQGGLALKACEDGSQRRSRAVKRRRGRAAHKDSSDDEDMDEMEQEASVCSDQHSSDEEDEEEIEVPRRCQRGAVALAPPKMTTDVEADMVPAAASVAEGTSTCHTEVHAADAVGAPANGVPEAAACCTVVGVGAVQAVFDAWHDIPAPGTDVVGGMALGTCLPVPVLAVDNATMPAEFACVDAIADGPEGPFLPLADATLAEAAAAAGDPVHPAVADGMVPIGSSGSPHPAGLHPPAFGGCSLASPPYASYIHAVSVVRPPSRFTVARVRCGAPVGLPPLSASARVAAAGVAAAAGTATSKSRLDGQVNAEAAAKKHDSAAAAQEEDHAGDRCSTGGGAPSPCDARFARPYVHDSMYDGFGYEYVAYGPPPQFSCHAPPPCFYRSAPYTMAPYPCRAMSSASYPPAPNCSSGGGATSSFSPAGPWPAVQSPNDGSGPFPQRQVSLESSSHFDAACYPQPLRSHQHHQLPPAWGPWGPADGPIAAAPWHGAAPPPYGHDAQWSRCTLGRSAPPPVLCGYGLGGAACCACGACSDAASFHNAATKCQNHQGMRPAPYYCYAYGTRYSLPAYPPRHDAWAGAPAARDPLDGSAGEGEACSSSVSDHDGQEPGRWSPCSGISGQGSQQPAKPSCMSPSAAGPGAAQLQWVRGCGPQAFKMVPHTGYHEGPHRGGCYPFPMHPYARGIPTVGSVTSMSSLAAVYEESPFLRPLGVAKEGAPQCTDVPEAPSPAAAGDTCEVLPYLAEGPMSPHCASDDVAVAADGENATAAVVSASRAGGAGLEEGDCGLGLADGFGGVARDAMDQDLAFAFENFVACDAPFDALACQ